MSRLNESNNGDMVQGNDSQRKVLCVCVCVLNEAAAILFIPLFFFL